MDASLTTLNNDDHINHAGVWVESISRLSSMSVSSIQTLLDKRLHSLTCPWKASIPFSLYVVDIGEEMSPSLFDESPNTVDLCSFLNGQKLSASRLYFNPLTYPPPINDDVMKGGRGEPHARVGLH